MVQRLNICLGISHSHTTSPHDHNHHHDGAAHEEHDHLDHYHHAGHTHAHQPGFHTHHTHPEIGSPSSLVSVATAIPKIISSFQKIQTEFLKQPASPEALSSVVSNFIVELHDYTLSKSEILTLLSDKRISEIQPQLWSILSTIECRNELIEARSFLARSSISLKDVFSYKYGGDYEPLVQRYI